jgi:hypothetical protein
MEKPAVITVKERLFRRKKISKLKSHFATTRMKAKGKEILVSGRWQGKVKRISGK